MKRIRRTYVHFLGPDCDGKPVRLGDLVEVTYQGRTWVDRVERIEQLSDSHELQYLLVESAETVNAKHIRLVKDQDQPAPVNVPQKQPDLSEDRLRLYEQAMREAMQLLKRKWRQRHGSGMPVQELGDPESDLYARAYRILERALATRQGD